MNVNKKGKYIILLLIAAESISVLIGLFNVFSKVSAGGEFYIKKAEKEEIIETKNFSRNNSVSDKVAKLLNSLFANDDSNDVQETERNNNISVDVPDIIGTDSDIARNMVEGLGLKYDVAYDYDNDHEYNTVMLQTPEAGETIKKGEYIYVLVSNGKKPLKSVQIPNVIGLTAEEAEYVLSQIGLNIGDVVYEYSDAPEYIIIGQSAPAGDEAVEGFALDLLVSKGSKHKGEQREYSQSGKNSGNIDDTQLCVAAADYYEKHHGIRPPCVRINGYDGDIVMIHLYEAMTDHDATWDWYYVNRITGETTDFEGAKFNIFEDTIVNKVDKSEDDADKEEKDVVITKDTFGSDDSIYTVQIGWNVISIEDGAFSKLVNLKEISVDTRNPYYASYGGCLYNKDFTQLICIPQNTTSVQIKSSVTSYTPHALDGLDQSRIDKMNDLINGQ